MYFLKKSFQLRFSATFLRVYGGLHVLLKKRNQSSEGSCVHTPAISSTEKSTSFSFSSIGTSCIQAEWTYSSVYETETFFTICGRNGNELHIYNYQQK
jgi:hypothetical protein